jgi:hypothetical protein
VSMFDSPFPVETLGLPRLFVGDADGVAYVQVSFGAALPV